MAKKTEAKGPRRQCEANTRKGVRCARRSMPGKRRCFAHYTPPDRRKGVGGRHKIAWSDLQWKAFESMCTLTNKKHRVARSMGNDEKTINRLVSERYGSSFSEFLHKRFEDGNFKLLAKQFEMAVGTDPGARPTKRCSSGWASNASTRSTRRSPRRVTRSAAASSSYRSRKRRGEMFDYPIIISISWEDDYADEDEELKAANADAARARQIELRAEHGKARPIVHWMVWRGWIPLRSTRRRTATATLNFRRRS